MQHVFLFSIRFRRSILHWAALADDAQAVEELAAGLPKSVVNLPTEQASSVDDLTVLCGRTRKRRGSCTPIMVARVRKFNARSKAGGSQAWPDMLIFECVTPLLVAMSSASFDTVEALLKAPTFAKNQF